MRKIAAECIGTFALVSAVCATGVLGGAGGGGPTQALAVGTMATAMMVAVGHISGGHFNPAVTIGLVAASRHPASKAFGYIFAQLLGAALAAFVWYVLANAKTGAGPAELGSFGANGYDAASPGHYAMAAVGLAEALASALLVFVFAGTTSKNAHRVLAPIAVGCALFALLLMTSPFSLGSLNPARSTATALFGGQVALSQLWLFWVAPIAGAVLGGLASRYVQNGD